MHEVLLRDASYLHHLDGELFDIGFDHDNYLPIHFYEEGYLADPEAWIQGSFVLSGHLSAQNLPDISSTDMRFQLTAQSVAYAQMPHHAPLSAYQIEDIGCLEMEPRLLRSLSWHEAPTYSREIPETQRPAMILFGSDGEPCGYRKASGNPHAYIWRDAVVATESGAFCVPEDSFIAMNYAPGEDPREWYAGTSLISFENIRLPQSIDFLRFSTASLSTTIMVRGAYSTVNRAPKLSENIAELKNFSPQYIGERVQSLLKQERALRVGH